MVSAGDFRNGVTLEIDGQVVQILEFQHVKPGKGAAFVRTKLKNVINGGGLHYMADFLSSFQERTHRRGTEDFQRE